MFNDIIGIILKSAEDAFLQVGVFVGAVLIIFGYLDYKKGGKLVRGIENSKRLQPAIGAFLGLTPGCGGAILVMPLFIKGSISFGTVIATLIATMGDSAFVLITVSMKHYILVSILSFIIAILVGYLVDYLNLEERLNLRKNIEKSKKVASHKGLENVQTEFEKGNCKNCTSHNNNALHIGHNEGDYIDIALHHSKKETSLSIWSHKFTHGIGYKIFWLLITIGLVLGIALLAQIDVNTSMIIPHLGSIIGISGTIFSIVYMIINNKFLGDDTHEETESKMFSLKETFIHNAGETAFVNTWVFVAYVIYEISIYFMGGESVVQGWLTATGFISVIVGASIGLIPGCGPQIIFVTLFTKGFVPFAALLSNAISQDGDALFPLIAMDKKSSFWATVVTTIPALLFGAIFYFIEIKFLK
ncbi:putative manganese transporter [Hathewaya histolytica]|uniref:putative manganese transporter n=1 Tax=Hathewaya histolytica TaxID=1498 RepID=UPI003B685734